MAAAKTRKTTTALVMMTATLRRSSSSIFSLSAALIFLLFLISTKVTPASALNHAVLSVKYKYAGQEPSLIALRAHDDRRQLRILAGVDLPLGGSGRPDAVGLYYARIGIGTPPKDYYVQVDTGSDIMWVNCIQCKDCPTRSSLGIDLTLYDIKDSSTGKLVPCDGEFCLEVNGGPLSGCKANVTCPYLQIYGDGSSTAGYFVKDVVQYDRVSGDLETTSSNGSVIFGDIDQVQRYNNFTFSIGSVGVSPCQLVREDTLMPLLDYRSLFGVL